MNGECMICGGADEVHGMFLGKPCPQSKGEVTPLTMARAAIHLLEEQRKERLEILELERLYRLEARACHK